jgi:hypothetical protein
MAPLFGTEIFNVVGADVLIQASRQSGPGRRLDQWQNLGAPVNSSGKREKKRQHHMSVDA